MANSYNIGKSTKSVFLEADLNTIGLAASRAIVLVVEDPNDLGTPVAHSTDATGDIKKQNISKNVVLKGKRLSVFTKVSLIGSDANARKIEADAISADYSLSGGDDGDKTYGLTSKDYIDPNVFVNFIVDLL